LLFNLLRKKESLR
jgi:hypothetical protein